MLPQHREMSTNDNLSPAQAAMEARNLGWDAHQMHSGAFQIWSPPENPGWTCWVEPRPDDEGWNYNLEVDEAIVCSFWSTHSGHAPTLADLLDRLPRPEGTRVAIVSNRGSGQAKPFRIGTTDSDGWDFMFATSERFASRRAAVRYAAARGWAL